MRKSHFTEEQIIGVLKESEAWIAMADLCRKHWRQSADLLSMEGEVWGPGSERGAPAARAGRRKPAAQVSPGRVDAGCPGAQGGVIKKVVDLQARRDAVTVAMAAAGLSQRRACRLIPLWRGTMRYQAKAGKRSQEMSNFVYGCAS